MSGHAAGLEIDLASALDAEATTGAGVPHGAELLTLANAVHRDTSSLKLARDRVESRLGTDGLYEAAATIAIFNGLVRVADGTGIQLDDGVVAASADYREQLGVNSFAGASNTVTGTGGDGPTIELEGASIRDLFA